MAGFGLVKRGFLSHVGRSNPRSCTPYLGLVRAAFQRSAMSTSPRPPFSTEPAHKWTQPPDESWKLGDGLKETTELGRKWKEDESAGWKTMDLDEMEKPYVHYLALLRRFSCPVSPVRDVYKFLISAVVPRPIAFVSSLSDTGEPNLAPFRYDAGLLDMNESADTSLAISLSYVTPT